MTPIAFLAALLATIALGCAIAALIVSTIRAHQEEQDHRRAIDSVRRPSSNRYTA